MSNFRKKHSNLEIQRFRDNLYNQFKLFTEEVAPEVNWIVDAGVLLGHVREQNFISTDSDLDLVIFAENLNKIHRPFGNLFSKIQYENLEVKFKEPHSMMNKNFVIKETDCPSAIMELYFSYPWNENWRLCMGGFNNFYLQPTYVTDTKEDTFLDLTVKVPKDSHNYLTYLYKDYMTPGKKHYYKIFLNGLGYHKRIQYMYDESGNINPVFTDELIKDELDREIRNFEEVMNMKNNELF